MTKWDALDSEFNEDAKNVFDYLKEGYKASLDAYINTLEESEQKNIENRLINLRHILESIVDPILDNLSQIQYDAYVQLKMLENKVGKWDKEKEKIKKLLWWDDVAKGLAKQNQQNKSEQSKTNTESDTSNITLPATLNLDGQAQFIHLIILINYFKIKTSPWHEPLKNPQRTLYNSKGVEKPSNGAFGLVRTNENGNKKAHTGLDLFADIGTPCYACLDGEIASLHEDPKGFGDVLVLKVSGDDLRKSRNSYIIEYKYEFEDEDEDDFDINADYFYLRYCHLSQRLKSLKEGVKVKAGDLLGYTGDTGNAKGAINPHLHFEIAMKYRYNKSTKKDNETNKLGFKINAAFLLI